MRVDVNVTYKIAETAEEFAQAKLLFIEYATLLGVDLSFQGFDAELEAIGRQYSAPTGGLLLAMINHQAVGCAAVRKLDGATAELKRMYVKNEYRGYRIGVQLLTLSLSMAKQLGYKAVRLDTLENMHKAQELYKSFGFNIIHPYRYNPLPGTVYMEKVL